MDNDKVVKVAAAAGLGYLVWRYVYLPYRMRQIIAQQAAAAGMSSDAWLQKVGSAACQAVGVYYHIPPNASGGVCNSLATTAAQVAQGLPGILAGIGQAAASSTLAAANVLPAVGTGVGGLVSGGVGGVAKGMTSLTDASVYGGKAALGLVGDAGSLIKKGVIGAAVLPAQATKEVIGAVAGGVKSAVHAFTSIF